MPINQPTDEEVMEAARLLVRMGRPHCPAEDLDRVARAVIADPYYTNEVGTTAAQSAVGRIHDAMRLVSARQTAFQQEVEYVKVGQRIGIGEGYGVVAEIDEFGTSREYSCPCIVATIILDTPDPYEDPYTEDWLPGTTVWMPKPLGSMMGPPLKGLGF